MSEDIRNVFISHIREDDASLAHLKSTVLFVSTLWCTLLGRNGCKLPVGQRILNGK